jgi:hypothetical protein
MMPSCLHVFFYRTIAAVCFEAKWSPRSFSGSGLSLHESDPGRGITAGICVAFIAITADRLIGAWAQKRKSELGLNAESQL